MSRSVRSFNLWPAKPLPSRSSTQVWAEYSKIVANTTQLQSIQLLNLTNIGLNSTQTISSIVHVNNLIWNLDYLFVLSDMRDFNFCCRRILWWRRFADCD